MKRSYRSLCRKCSVSWWDHGYFDGSNDHPWSGAHRRAWPRVPKNPAAKHPPYLRAAAALAGAWGRVGLGHRVDERSLRAVRHWAVRTLEPETRIPLTAAETDACLFLLAFTAAHGVADPPLSVSEEAVRSRPVLEEEAS